MKKYITIGAALLLTLSAYAQPKIVAHRGFHSKEGSYENTISSLRNAQELGVYGVEFDVHLTADDSLVIHHDVNLNIDNKKVNIQKSDYATVMKVQLPNNLRMPSLREFLEQGKKDPKTKLIMELKPHYSAERETRLVEAVLDMTREMRMNDQIEFISFSLHICDEVRRLQPDAFVCYVSSSYTPMSPEEVNAHGIKGLSYMANALLNQPAITDKANKLGIATTLWFADDYEVIDWAIRHKISYISTNCPDKAKAYLEAVGNYR